MLKTMLNDALSLMNVMNNMHVSRSGIKYIFICSQIGVTLSRSGFTTFSSSRTGITNKQKKSLISNLDIYPHAILKKRRGYCYRLRPSVRQSVRPLCYLLQNHLRGAQRIFFGPVPLGPGEGSKGQISFNFNYKVNLKKNYSKLCVCSHK